jgi:hypothetical protein
MLTTWVARRWRAVAGAAALSMAMLASPANAGEKRAIGFAGIAYTGSEAAVEQRFPHVSAAIAAVGPVAYRSRLVQAFHARPPRHFELLPDDQLQRLDGVGSSTVMAIALDRETTSVERIDGRWKVLFEVAAQALFFDFREKQVLFSYPITVQYVDVLDAEPRDADLRAMAKRLVEGGGVSGLLSVVPTELEHLALPEASSRRLQVAEVALADVARSKLSARHRDADLVAHEFSKVFASTLRLPMLPHATGQAVGGAMSGRFADGAAFRLRIPEADYRISVRLDDFREKSLAEQGGFRQQLYGAFFHVRVEEPMSARGYFDQSLRQGSTKAIPDSQDLVDSEAAYYETLLAGFASLAQSIDGGAKPWASEQPGGRAFTQELKSLKELIGQCR